MIYNYSVECGSILQALPLMLRKEKERDWYATVSM